MKSEKAKINSQKIIQLEKATVRNLFTLDEGYNRVSWRRKQMSNTYENKLVFNRKNSMKNRMAGVEEVGYVKGTWSDDEITMLARLSGGQAAKIGPSFMIFTDKKIKYLILGRPRWLL